MQLATLDWGHNAASPSFWTVLPENMKGAVFLASARHAARFVDRMLIRSKGAIVLVVGRQNNVRCRSYQGHTLHKLSARG